MNVLGDILAAFAAHTWLFATSVVLLGLVVGSFLNVVIARMPRGMEQQWAAECREWLESQGVGAEHLPEPPAGPGGIAGPRSQCPACGAAIRARDNIPLLSWLLLRGRCRDCSAPISIQYPLVEAAAAGLGLVVALYFGPGWPALLALVFTWTLLAATVIDLRTMLLPDDLTLPLLWLGLLVAVAGVGFASPADAIIGAAAGYGILWSLFHAFRLLTGKEGMGYGDFKLLAALGAWMGWQALPVVVILSSAVGALVGIGLIVLRGQDRSVPIPFGPYLAAGGWIALLWGDAISRAYLNWALG
jgi:leader peptidase (prepilin peptidase) / N-methyltransferase